MPQLYTSGGYVLSEVISALQKEVRRGNEREAMFWALECIPRYEAYLWRRLCVIVNEDIGPANPMLLLIVPLQRSLFMELREESRDGPARLVLANVILMMCRSEKSRVSDHFQCAIHQARVQGKLKLEVPDHALDKHTGRGRRLGRGWDHFKEVGTLLVNEAESVPDPYRDEAFELWPTMVDAKWPKRGAPKGAGQQLRLTEDDIERISETDGDGEGGE